MRKAALTFAGNEVTSSGLIDAYEYAECALRHRTGGTQSAAAVRHPSGGVAAYHRCEAGTGLDGMPTRFRGHNHEGGSTHMRLHSFRTKLLWYIKKSVNRLLFLILVFDFDSIIT